MRDDSELDWTLIDGYLAGDLTPGQAEEVERWVEKHPEQRVVIDQLRKNWPRIHQRRAQPFDLATIERSMLARIADPAVGEPVSTPNGESDSLPPRRNAPRILPMQRVSPSRGAWAACSVAAVAAIAMVIGVTLRRESQLANPATTVARTYRTRTGQHAAITLPGGSRAVLGPATTLQFSVAPTQAITVTVDGEALFTVTHHAQRPFTVQTRTTVTRVLGTQFDVRQYAADAVARVVVAAGRVSLHSARRAPAGGAVMTARMVGTVDDSGRVRVAPSGSIEDYTAWTTGRLVFRQTPARDVVADLGRAYGVEISLPDSALAQRTLTWSLPVTEVTLAGALDVLTTVLRAHVVQSGNLITIVPGRVTSAQRRVGDSLYRLEHAYGR